MEKYLKITLFSSWAGLLFTGIICGTKLFVGDWLIIEPYPHFLWFPSWWVCFGLFVVIFILTSAANKKRTEIETTAFAIGLIAFLGSLLTGRYMVDVLVNRQVIVEKAEYVVLFPWSLYVFLIFAVLFVLSAAYLLIKTNGKVKDC